MMQQVLELLGTIGLPFLSVVFSSLIVALRVGDLRIILRFIFGNANAFVFLNSIYVIAVELFIVLELDVDTLEFVGRELEFLPHIIQLLFELCQLTLGDVLNYFLLLDGRVGLSLEMLLLQL